MISQLLPVLFQVGPITVYSYGVAIALAFLISLFIIMHESKRKGFNPDFAYDLVLFAMVGGIAGARLVYVIDHWHDFAASPTQIFAIWQGGLVFYGGLIGGALAVLGLVKMKKMSIGKVADIVAPCLAIGSAVGRLGCFSNGCCYGQATNVPWAITFNNPLSAAQPLGVPLHPTQLYEAGYNILILGVLWFSRKKVKSDGLLFWLYIALYGLFRFIVEFFRANPDVIFGLSASQLFSVFMLVAGLTVIFAYYPRPANVVAGREG
ncbi:MAG: prolipoprotein diacylglyceryl transferase [Candidatus Aquicultor sp.]|nr:prolipoprotein diacylglyceryl transferase [Candidatus Aquicultor sp.]